MKMTELQEIICEFLQQYVKDNGYSIKGPCECKIIQLGGYIQCSIKIFDENNGENYAYESTMYYKQLPIHLLRLKYESILKLVAKVSLEELEIIEGRI